MTVDVNIDRQISMSITGYEAESVLAGSCVCSSISFHGLQICLSMSLDVRQGFF